MRCAVVNPACRYGAAISTHTTRHTQCTLDHIFLLVVGTMIVRCKMQVALFGVTAHIRFQTMEGGGQNEWVGNCTRRTRKRAKGKGKGRHSEGVLQIRSFFVFVFLSVFSRRTVMTVSATAAMLTTTLLTTILIVMLAAMQAAVLCGSSFDRCL